MMQRSDSGGTDTPSHAILSQAAEWYACLRDGSATDTERAAWRAWLQQDPMHGTAWRYVEQVSSAFAPVCSAPDPRGLVDRLSTANERLRKRRRVFVSASVLACGGFLGWFSWRQSWLPDGVLALGADYRTDTGEQREIVLADGTRVWLNTSSAINVSLDGPMRRLVLLAGEVFIQTAHDTSRPFIVDTSQGSMEPLGTRFNVRLDDPVTQLAVYDGAVQIRTAISGETAIIGMGRQVSFTRTHIDQEHAADQAREAWAQGRLVATNISLRDMVTELSRYRTGYLGVDDSVAELTVYGSFPIRDTDHVLRMLASALPIRIVHTLPWWTRIQARP